MMKKSWAVAALIATTLNVFGQLVTFPRNGAADPRHTIYALTNAKIQIDADNVIEKGTLLIQDGRIIDVAANVAIPKGAVVMDMTGKWIYPSFIDPFTSYGMPEVKRHPWTPGPKYERAQPGTRGWNDALNPENQAHQLFQHDEKSAEQYRGIGYGVLMIHHPDGIARGTSAVVTLHTEGGENLSVVKDRAASCYSFNKGSSRQEYPSSLMGAIALLRQTYYDADWYRMSKNRAEYNATLEAFNANRMLPQIFETSNKWNVLRADKVGDEFSTQYIFKGSGTEYQRMDEMRATNGKFILPLNFPAAFDISDPYDAELLDYADMKHWELAPLNPGAFEKYRIAFALTASDLGDKKDFWGNLRKAIAYGLSEKEALRALTTTPAQMLGVQDQVGALKKGMLANFLITSGNIFQEQTVIYDNWIQGTRYVVRDMNALDVRGTYNLNIVGSAARVLNIEGDVYKLKGVFSSANHDKDKVSVKQDGVNISISFQSKEHNGTVLLSGAVDATSKFMSGKAQLPDGKWVDWMATNSGPFTPKEEKPDTATTVYPTLDDVIYPFSAYGRTKADPNFFTRVKNRYKAVLIKNATVWTNEKDSVLPNTDVLVVEGRIVRVAKGIIPAKELFAREIDATGKHLTVGLIDEHSHIAISGGVNEGSQASTAEVRIGDVINPDDVNIYRQLAGGVVASQLLHGSANPIGGQSGLIKLRWGANAEEMKIQGADGFIKFALGENVKQANWGDDHTIRFPQTRMGVEQVYYDHFIRAREYQLAMDAYNKLPAVEKAKRPAPKRDLELDALSEILNQKRFITCHSYIQSEIAMLMSVADSMKFKVNTFTHILEGYKVADKMKAHGAGGSSFADWWAYKYEVKDAIPYNPALLHRMGIVTAINSDDAEMARRLNQEAAKSMKYGGLSATEALTLVSLNPAKLLHLDKNMGSIAVNKDADLVLWSDNPLSVYAKVEMTMVDGQILYDAKEDVLLREKMRSDRARLTQLMIKEKNDGGPLQRPRARTPKMWHCEDMHVNEDYLNDFINEQ
jgi:imidazolonepropionase-like amidohydrolase